MKSLFYKQQGVKIKIIKTIFLFLTTFLFFTSCFQSTKNSLNPKIQVKIDAEDREWMTKFFKDLMLDQQAIYTLWGSKPITTALVYDYTQEEIDAWVNSLSAEQKKACVYKEDPSTLRETWEKWEKISSQYPITKYLIFKRPCRTTTKVHEIVFVDILNTALMIERYHETFARITDLKFDALDIVFEIQDEESEFWNEVYDSSVLTGLLLGYGEKNAWCFNWCHSIHKNDLSAKAMAFADTLPYGFPEDHRNYGKVSITHFSLPPFASFSPQGTDEIIIKYQNERKHIQEIYKNKNFLEYTLERLMR